MLLGSAGLMGKSLLRVLSTDPGFRPEGALGVTVVAPDALVEKDEAAIALQARMLEALEAVPGVSGATRVSRLPGTGNGNTQRFLVEDVPRPRAPQPEAALPRGGPGLLPACSASRCSPDALPAPRTRSTRYRYQW